MSQQAYPMLDEVFLDRLIPIEAVRGRTPDAPLLEDPVAPSAGNVVPIDGR